MPRHPRLFLPGAIYHVYCRVARGEFVIRMKSAGGCSIAELSSRSRNSDHTRRRIEFSTLAIGRYRLRVCDVANLLNKHRNSVTKWLNTGLRLKGEDSEFKERLDYLDATISRQN